MNDLAVFCWSHTSYQDLLPVFTGRLVKYWPELGKGYVALEAHCDVDCAPLQQLINDETFPYWQRFTDCLKKVKEDFILYCQEDFILYGKVDGDELNKVFQWGKTNQYSCIKLLRSGPDSLSIPLSHRLYQSSAELAAVHQATIWNKEHLIKLLAACQPESVRDFERNQLASKAMVALDMRSCFYFHEQSPSRGGHYDSLIFPYTATAVSAGKWNTMEYGPEIEAIAQEYHVSLEQRGCL